MENLEIYYNVINTMYLWGIIVLTACCYYYLVKQFMQDIKYLWTVAAAYMITMVFLYYIPVVIGNFQAYALGAAAGLAAMYILEQRNLEQKIFLAVTFFSLRWLSAAIVTCLIEQLSSLHKTDGNKSWKIILRDYTVESIMEIFFVFLLLFISVKIISKVYIYKKEIMTKKELAVLLVPSLCMVMGYAMQLHNLSLLEKQLGEPPYELYYSQGWLYFLYYGISFATILIMIVMFQRIKAKQREEHQTRQLLGQLGDMKKHIREIEKLYCDIRRLKHDIGNHIVTLESLCSKKQYKEAEEYVSNLREDFRDTADKIKSGNPVTDVILLEKSMQADEKGITFISEFHYPEGAGIDAFDISVILNNSLDNAIESAEKCKDAYISILSYRRKNVCMIEIQNSSAKKCKIDAESGLPVTTKSEEGHGFGLLGIRRTAWKYCGDIDIKQEEGLFKLSVMLIAE